MSARRFERAAPVKRLGLAAAVVLMAFSVPWQKDVVRFVNALPGQRFSEIVETQTLQTIDVTVARVPPVKAFRLREFAPGAIVVFHTVSASGHQAELQHRITFPALPAGVYQVRFASAERTAYQTLNVGTIAAMLNLDEKSAVVIATDVRTGRVRRDVTVLIYTVDGVRTLHAGSDGLVRFPIRVLVAHSERMWNPDADAIIVRASDGSIAGLGFAYSSGGGLATFTQTDQQAYRVGDRAFYRFFSRDPTSFFTPLGLLATRSRVISESGIVRPWSSTESGADFFIATPTEAQYRIDAGPLTRVVREGDLARIVISVTHWDERPAPHVPVAFAICEGPPRALVLIGMCAESFGHGVTDAYGDLTTTVTAHRQDFSIYVLERGFREVAAYANVSVIPKHNALRIAAPREVYPAKCFPVVVSERAPNGAPAGDRGVRLESRLVQNGEAGPASPPSWRRLLRTQPGGYSFARWCPPKSTQGSYEITAHDVNDPSVAATADLQIDATPPLFRPEGDVTFIAPVEPVTQAGSLAKMIAASVTDGDALALYGADGDLHATTVSFHDGIARFDVRSPTNLDDFSVDVVSPSFPDSQSVAVTVVPKMHMLHVTLGCLKRTNILCAHVSNWRAVGVPARLYIDVTRSTRAGVLDALARSNAPYQALYGASDLPLAGGTWGGAPSGKQATSYLYAASQRYSVSVQAPTQPTAAPPQTPALTPSPSLAPDSTPILGWFNDMQTDRSGNLRLSLASLLPRRGIVLIRVIAVDSDGRIGEGVTSLSR